MESSPQPGPAPQASAIDYRTEDRDGAGQPAPARPGGRTLWGEPLRRLVAIALALLAIAIAIAAPAALRAHGISPFDEVTHADYAYQVAHGHIPARGTVIAPAIHEELPCRGSALRKIKLRPCGVIAPVSAPSNAQTNYNFSHPPLYYAITGVLVRAGEAIAPGHQFITFARLLGILWLFAAMLILYVALRRFSVRWPIAACGAVMLASSPAVFYPAATVTNDAAAAVAGSLAVLTLARITVTGKLGWKLPALFALLAAATKILNALPFLAIAAVVAVLGLRDWRVDRARALRLLRITLGIVVGFLVVYLGWKIFQDHRGDPHWVSPIAGISSRPVHGAPFDELFSTSFTAMSLLSTGYVPPLLSNAWLVTLLRVWGSLGVGATVALLALHQRWTPRFTLAACAVIGIVSVPWAVELEIYVGTGTYFPAVVSRYFISFIPMTLACIAVVANDRRWAKSIAAFTGICLAVALYTVSWAA